MVTVITSLFGKGQMGSALMGSLQFSCFFDRGTFGVFPLTYLLYTQKCLGTPSQWWVRPIQVIRLCSSCLLLVFYCYVCLVCLLLLLICLISPPHSGDQNSFSENPRVEKLEGFPARGGIHPCEIALHSGRTPEFPPLLRPVHLLRVFLLRVLKSNFPGDSI